jgi:hypothetical protein
MGNSTVKLQDVADYVSTIGDLSTGLPVGGFTNLLAQSIANDVMTELLSERFNFKFNRMVVTPFYTNSLQQDYVGLLTNIGWLEHAICVDINNTALPKPIQQLEVKRDLERTSYQYGIPAKVCWLPNDQLVQGTWPGAGQTYTNPLGATAMPNNPTTNILDKNGNILYLTTYGTTGLTAPFLAADATVGSTVNDGTCVWTKADPKAQGFRLSPLPPQQGIVFQVCIFAQARPVRFTSMAQTLDPITDDCAKYFQDGFIAIAHRHTTAPVVRARYEKLRADWIESVMQAVRQNNRESTDVGFYPDRGIVQSTDINVVPVGPFWPYQY